MPKRVAVICHICEKPFEVMPSRVGTVKTCSPECRRSSRAEASRAYWTGRKREHRAERVVVACQQCGKDMEVRAKVAERVRFCSNDCRNLHRTTLVAATCAGCGKEFQIPRCRVGKVLTCSLVCRWRRWKATGGGPKCGAKPGAFAGERNPMYARLPGCKTWIDVNEPGHEPLRVRSEWEADLAKELLRRGEPFEYESRRFVLRDGLTYCPDFYLPARGLWLEVKGRRKLRDFEIERLFPEPLVMLRANDIRNIEKTVGSLLSVYPPR